MGLLHFRACAGFLILVLEVIFNLGGAWGGDLADLVTNLPGQPPVNFKQYAGYVTVNESHGRALFYWFVEADQKDPALLPLVFWFTGGPGCSSIGGGFLQEIGPFFTNANGTGLIRNKHTWNKYANIVFVDSPSGTGYSYSNTTSDYSVFTDQSTAEDNLAFTLGWFAKFPEYKKNKFYLTGESFAGHYLPELAEQIVLYNEKPGLDYKINFKGFAVGNALTDGYSDNLGTIKFYYYHSLISDQTYTTLIENCNFSVDGPTVGSIPNATCDNAVDYVYGVELAEINPYNIYSLNCNPPATTNRPAFIKRVNMIQFAGVNPCPPDTVTPYLNLPAVKAALHARQDIEWIFCSNIVYENYSAPDFTRSILPFYRFLLTKDLRIWVYSGDVDGIVPTTGTRIWLAKLNLPIETPWYPWNHSSQVGGWSQVYTNLTFTTVRDSGHQVPLYQPGRALQLFKYFLKGQSLPGFDSKN